MRIIYSIGLIFIVYSISAGFVFSRTSTNRIYSEYLHYRFYSIGPGWIPLSPKELPAELTYSNNMLKRKSFFSGFKLANSNALVIFEFTYPDYIQDLNFCRSRVYIYQLYDYTPNKKYAYTQKTSSEKELVSFNNENILNKCKATSIHDLDNYIYMEARLDDYDLVELWNVYEGFINGKSKSKFQCNLTENTLLRKIGVGNSGEHGEKNNYYFLAQNEHYHFSMELTNKGGVLRIDRCNSVSNDSPSIEN